MRFLATALASCALAFLLLGPAAAQGQKPPPPAPPKPYKTVAVEPPQPFKDASFDEFRKQLGDVVKRKDRTALKNMVVGDGFFWETEDGDKTDKKKSSFDNFVNAVGLNAKDGSGWELLEAAAEEPTLEEVQDRKGVMCAPASPNFDENAFEELTKATRTEVEEWGYPTVAGVEVRANAKANSPVIEKLGLNLVRVLESEDIPTNPNAPPPAMKVVTPAGKVGYVSADSVVPIVFDQLCYMKDGATWKIAGYAGGGD
jgi:hypothetical protein